MKDISPLLRSLGLIDSEINIYLSALEKGPGTVLDLAKSAKLSRQAVYVAIESLTERGLMSSALRGKKRFYAAEHPDKLLAYAMRREAEMKEKMKDLERMLPELELQVGGERPVVKTFEGKEGVRAIIADIAQTKPSIMYEVTDIEAMNATLDVATDLSPMRNVLKSIGTRVRGMYAGEVTGDPGTRLERYLLPKDDGRFKSNITIYGDKAALVTFEGKMHSVIIESKALVSALKVIFKYALEEASQILPKK